MKKITFVLNNFLTGGVERFLLELLRHLDRRKFDISIVTILGAGPMEGRFRKLGVPIFILGPKKYPRFDLIKFFWLLPIFVRLTIFLRKTKPDIVITSLYQADILGIFSAWLAGIKKRIFVQHDVWQLNIVFKRLKKFFAANLSTQIVANSYTTRNFLISYWKIPKGNIIVINNGIDVDKIEQGIKKEYSPEEIVLGIVGRLEPVKGHIVLLEALKLLREKHNFSPKTLFVGDGSLRQQLEEFIKENDLDNVQITGMTLGVIEKLKLIDILIVPSLSEGFGFAALEGLFSHKIVVASDLPAIREFVTDKKNGFLFNPGDSQRLTDILYQLLSDMVFYENIKREIEMWTHKERSNFDIRNIALQYEKLF